MCFKALRRAEMLVRTDKVGLLLEQGWVWSI